MKCMQYLVFFFLSFITYVANSLVIGTLSNAPPFTFLEGPNNLSGFDIDLMNSICKRIKRKCTYNTYNFHKVFDALEDGQIDLAIAEIIITPEREQHLLFSLPYKLQSYQYLTPLKTNIKSPAQLTGKTIGVYNSSPDKALIYKQFKDTIKVMLYEHVEQMVNALKEKKVDVIMLEDNRAAYWLANTKGFKLLGKPFQSGAGYGIAAKQGRESLIKEINAAIKEMEKDGSYLTIYQRYF